jgi:amidohydrolase
MTDSNDQLNQLRRELHNRPELAGGEVETARTIADHLKRFEPTRVMTGLGGHGAAGVFDSGRDGPTVMLRADLDALPIQEINNFDYRSRTPGVGHKCGHDGHMTILVGVATKLPETLPELKGRVVLLFQPAEEVARGAKAVMEDDKFTEIEPDYVFGLHNLPGFPEGSIILCRGEFASASRGLVVRLSGRTSHAGEPHHGKSPVLAVTSLIHALMDLPRLCTPMERAALVTVIHVRIGEIAFGTSPSYAEVMATLRSHRDEEMEVMACRAEELVAGVARTHGLGHETDWVEEFPAVRNHDACVDIVEGAAKRIGAELIRPEFPFPWTEDFSYFLQKIPGAFFGLGAGEDHPQLHSADYDFPDQIIPRGIEMYIEILKAILAR